MLKIFLLFSVAFLCTIGASGLTCNRCSDYPYDGESTADDDCFNGVKATANNTDNVFQEVCSSSAYCITTFVLHNGLISSVDRRCENPLYDQDERTNQMPESNECEAIINGASESTTCYYACNTDYCNNIAVSTLKPCQTNCFVDEGRGNCDYFSGKCVCNSGWSGTNCQNSIQPIYRKCLQCNEETDVNCDTGNGLTAVQCPEDISTHNYCSVSKTLAIENGRLIRSMVTRGCTSTKLDEESCQLSSYSKSGLSDYDEYTCIATCTEDGCNTGTPGGVVIENEKALQCVQCERNGNNCNSSLTSCPPGSTHCKSTVSYYWDQNNLVTLKNSPWFKWISVVRECATGPVEAKCSSTTVSSNLQTVTCTETCTADGCNNRWPARPLCSQCSSSTAAGECFDSPPLPSVCANPYDSICTIQHMNRDNVKGYASSMERGCSFYSIGSSCSSTTFGDDTISTCNRSCTTDGCNQGSGAGVLAPSISLILMSTIWLLSV